ncbi:MAG: deoxyribonuclease V, partial [Chloroflexota bacterium]
VSRRDETPAQVRYVAGLDLSPPDARGVVRGAAVALSFPDLAPVEVQIAEAMPAFPYVPGLLSFREAPALLEALARLRHEPDIILVDGQGYAHPRRFGLACHIGVLTDRPAIGCAKSRLIGVAGHLARKKGAWVELTDAGETIGAVVRTRDGVAPVYASIGHKVDLAAAVRWMLACCKGYRIPEPTRQAHLAAAGRLIVAATATD